MTDIVVPTAAGLGAAARPIAERLAGVRRVRCASAGTARAASAGAAGGCTPAPGRASAVVAGRKRKHCENCDDAASSSNHGALSMTQTVAYGSGLHSSCSQNCRSLEQAYPSGHILLPPQVARQRVSTKTEVHPGVVRHVGFMSCWRHMSGSATSIG
jgi:hypothetical protein